MKKILRILVLFVFITIILWMTLHNQTYAIGAIETYRSYSYDSITQVDIDDLLYLSIDGTQMVGATSYNCNAMCMHISQTGTRKNVDGYAGSEEILECYIDIDTSGVATVHKVSSTSHGNLFSEATISNHTTELQVLARMCYYATVGEGENYYLKNSVAHSYVGSKYVDARVSIQYWWYNNRSILGLGGFTYSDTSNFDKAYYDIYDIAVENPENIECTARLYFYLTAGQQAVLMVFGKVGDSAPSINKYITKTTNDTYDRDEMSESEKKSDPVEVYPKDTIRYRIDLENNTSSAIRVTVTDTFDSEYFEFSSNSTAKGNGVNGAEWSGSGGSYSVTVSIPSGGCYLIVVLKVKSNVELTTSGVKKDNTASFTYKDVKYTSVDRVIIKTGISLKKYIVRVNTVDTSQVISGRSSYDEDEKKADPVEVGPGNTVTYRVVVINKTLHDISGLTVTDTYASGLTYSSGDPEWTSSGSRSYQISDVSVPAKSDGTNGRTTLTITLSVDESITIGNSYRNRASVTYCGVTINASDWVKVDPRNYCEKIYNICWLRII